MGRRRIKTIAKIKYIIAQHVSMPGCGEIGRSQRPGGFTPGV